MKYTLDHIAQIVASPSVVPPHVVEQLLLDSRKVYSPATSLFFAIRGEHRDGHRYLLEAYKKGVRSFIVSEKVDEGSFPAAAFVKVGDTLVALQQLAAHHRKRFNIPVIGITGSNGKTIVKEWLYQLLHPDFHIVRSPRSYNSQVGVPLSVWQMSEAHDLAIFEAGISKRGEMPRLANIIQPTIGVFTNIGAAHSEGFSDLGEKVKEKFELFNKAIPVILPGDDLLLRENAAHSNLVQYAWSHQHGQAWLHIVDVHKRAGSSTIQVRQASDLFSFSIPFVDDASIENAITCCAVLRYLNVPQEIIAERMTRLQPVNMRLELKKGINHCNIINDSYSADLSSLDIALNFLDQQAGAMMKTVILSDFLQSAIPDSQLYPSILDSLSKHNISRLIGIGAASAREFGSISKPGWKIELFQSTEEFLQQSRSSSFHEETVLIKGARIFGFERIVQMLEQKMHQTVLEVNLNAIVHNLKVYQQFLKPGTRLMAMVKAFAYGSGGAEIAGILQFHNVDYLGVAYADEGVELRKAGINLPIMVMNPEETAFGSLIEFNLEPDLYSMELLDKFEAFIGREALQQYPVHIEIETGMNRLGFDHDQLPQLASRLASTSALRVQSVFSHLSSSDNPGQDEFTHLQFQRFLSATDLLKQHLSYPFIEHIANSAAITRLPQLQLGMVRLGIGMYGVDSALISQDLLQPVATLRSTIAQLKHLKKGDTVSYNRRGVIDRDAVIATVRIGYADGFSRKLGNGVGRMFVKGRLAPVIGTVCMDMTMIDVTGIEDLREGEDVIIFGKELPIQRLAEWAGTIPYEVMTAISQRVKRVYFEE